MPTDYDRYADEAYRYHRRRGRAADQELSAFDPYEAIQTSARGLFDQFQRVYGDERGLLREGQIPGRLRSGFGQDDEDRLFLRLGDRLNENIAGLATTGAQMNLDRLGMLREHGAQALNLMTANRELDLARRTNRRRGIGAALGAIGGGLIGGAATYFTGGAAAPLIPELISGGGRVGAGIADAFGG